ncbi:MAG: hypothetical protein ABII22_04440 [Candidatus Micrarchaeota archaeon]
MTEKKIKSDPFNDMFQSSAKNTFEPAAAEKPKLVAVRKEEKTVVMNAPESKDTQFVLQTLSLSQDMLEWLDDNAHNVKKVTGFRKANRSSIARYAISKIKDKGIDHDEFMEFVKKEQGLK